MKTPFPVRIVGVLFGMVAMAMAIGCTSLLVRDVSQHPYNIQIAFVTMGTIVVGTSG
jgi:hypothetical protein